jgi:hypothetical protein
VVKKITTKYTSLLSDDDIVPSVFIHVHPWLILKDNK